MSSGRALRSPNAGPGRREVVGFVPLVVPERSNGKEHWLSPRGWAPTTQSAPHPGVGFYPIVAKGLNPRGAY